MLEYLKDHILDEIEGAEDYMTKAVEHKGTEYGCKFRKMAEMELEHANAMTAMFRKMEKPKSMTDAQYSEMLKGILKAYSEGMANIEALKKMYWAE